MKVAKVTVIAMLLCLLPTLSPGKRIDLSVLFTMNVQGELYPCG